MAAEPLMRGPQDCPDLETIAAYLDGRNSAAERAGVAEHLATCESCYFVFTEAAASKVAMLVDTAAPAWWKNPRIVLPSAAAGLAMAATIVLAVNAGLLRWDGSDPPQLTALVAAMGDERVIAPRLTGGFAHAPLRGAIRGGEPVVRTLSPDLRIAAALIEKQASPLGSAEALHARGIAALVTGEIDRAIIVLDQAVTARPDDARMLSDLAAAYLARADRDFKPEDLNRALASVNRALNADRTLPEALFNRAYALERLSLSAEAGDAWRAYLTIDDRSGWADEARTHLRSLGQR